MTPETMGMFIDGAEVPAASGQTFPVYAPATGAVVGHAADGQPRDIDQAVDAATRAFEAWSQLAPGQRERVLLGAADALELKSERFVDVVIDESGSTLNKARYEVAAAAMFLRTAAGEARRLYGDTFPNDRPDRLSFVMREALGVVAVVSPFNAPLALLAKMAAFPLAAGNTVVAKPSEETPLVAVMLAKLLSEAGIPKGVFNVVTGGAASGESLVRAEAVRGIAFTGSTATGRRIGALAIPRMCRLQLELGGKNPLLVLGDADVANAAAITVAGAFAHAGQICMAPSRILVDRVIAEPFAKALVAAAEKLHLGDLRDEKTAYGPLIHERSAAKVLAHIDDAVARGAKLLTGGSLARRLTVRPTVLWEPPKDSPVFCEETFGPVVSVVAVNGTEEAIAVANASDYGLSAAVLTSNVKAAFTVARRLRSGSVHIGTHSFQSNSVAPIGGYGLSGIGRSGGKYSIEAFTDLKWVSVDLGA